MKQRTRTIFGAAALLLLSACSTGDGRPSLEDEIDASENQLLENPTCEVPGNPANWLAAYCMWLNGTSQFDRDSEIKDDPVKQCIRTVDRHAAVPRKLCDRNKYFKQEICTRLAENGIYTGTVQSCIASRGTIPRVVREGL